MSYPDYEKINTMALTVACPHHLCGAPAGEPCETGTTGEGLPHYSRYELAVAPAVDEAVQKFAEPEPESRLLKLTLHTLGGVRDRSYRLDLVTDEERRFARLTVDQFAALLAGDQITVKAEL